MKKISLESPHMRARVAFGLAVAGLGLLGLVFFRTQVLRAGPDVLVEQGNRLRALPLPASRGAIHDRYGAVLAGSEPATALILMPASADSMRARLRRLAALLEMPEARRARLERMALASSRPLVVTTDLGPAQAGRLGASHRELPGVLLEAWPRRTYPGGHAVIPVVGEVGLEPWPAGSGENPAGPGAGRMVGRAGLEEALDSVLAGEAGLRYVEMDATGAVVGEPSRPAYRLPVPGRPVQTRLDAGLQRHVAELVPARGRSAVVVLDIATGDVLALYTHPSRLPGVGGVRQAVPENLAIAGAREPGAIFQVVTGALALESKRIDTERPQAVPCRGGMRYGERYFRCWQPAGHGQLALAGAILEACDVYFYQLGLRLGLQALLDAGARLGLGRATGIELPDEQAGSYPSSVPELAERLGRSPNPSDALELAAGQGLNRMTLLRMTHVYGALAAGGGAPAPRVTAVSTRSAPWRLELDSGQAEALLTMLDAVTAPGGPAAAASAALGAGMRIRGQLSRVPAGRESPRASRWFVGTAGFATGPDRIAIGVLSDQPVGQDAPAMLAGRIADYYLRNGGDEATPAAPDTTTPASTTVSSL